MPRLLASLVLLSIVAGTASARPPPDPEEEEEWRKAANLAFSSRKPTLIEWSSWFRGGVTVATGESPPTTTARVTTPIREADRRVAGAFGVGITLPIGSSARIGGWAEVRGWELPIAGGELLLIPGDLDMFFYKAKGAISLRAGGNPDVWTGQLGFHYRAPWNLFGIQPRGNRYMIGVGFVATATQNRLDPHDWSATLGLELEPLGAIRYLLGVRSWY